MKKIVVTGFFPALVCSISPNKAQFPLADKPLGLEEEWAIQLVKLTKAIAKDRMDRSIKEYKNLMSFMNWELKK